MEKKRYFISFDEIKEMLNLVDGDIILDIKQNHEMDRVELIVLQNE